MKLAFVGTSNIGKSYWSGQLEALGFERFCCDDLIETKLGAELASLGYSGINGVDRWMGQPNDDRYARTSQRYLELEQASMREILAAANSRPTDHNLVIDTTGSVIYTGADILFRLAKYCRIIYFSAPSEATAAMVEQYSLAPKMTIWDKYYQPLPGESPEAARARCYPILLRDRTQRYAQLADVTIDYHRQHAPGFTADDLLELIATA